MKNLVGSKLASLKDKLLAQEETLPQKVEGKVKKIISKLKK